MCQALFLAADKTRRIDPTLAARYHRLVLTGGKQHNSALCLVAAVLITRIAACWRNGQGVRLEPQVTATPNGPLPTVTVFTTVLVEVLTTLTVLELKLVT